MKYLFTTLKNQIMNGPWIAAVGVGALTLVAIGMLANAQGNSGRNIKLLPQAGEPFDIAAGSVFIYPDAPILGRFVEYSLHRLSKQGGPHGSLAFAIYVSTPSLGRFRLRTFNTTGADGPVNRWADFRLLPDEGNPLWSTETITVEVYVEADDGLDAPDAGGLLVLRGVDQP